MSVESSAFNVGRSAPKGAVFLSYASQDAAAAARLCAALRSAGVEVWFDQNELVGGDAWDAKIRKQIADCALFVPIISANTQARREGYFRLEWKLAAQRTHMIADGTPFLLPVVIDATRDTEALVPAEFKAVQWTRLPGGEPTTAFCAQVNKLLRGEFSAAPVAPAVELPKNVARPASGMSPLVVAGFGLALAVALAIWQPWKKALPAQPAQTLAPELASLRARIVPERWGYADYEVMRPALDRWIQSHPEDSDAMALRSCISSLQVLRTLDFGTKVLSEGKADAERASRLAPGSPLAELALGYHHVAMMTRGGEAEAARPHLERALAALPQDILTRYAQMGYYAFSLQLDRVRQAADAWLLADPAATFPRWCAAYASLVERKAEDAEKWAERGLPGGELATTVRSLSTLFETNFFLRANPRAARDTLERAPGTARSHHRLIYARWFLALAERQWDEAIQELARVPDTLLLDRCFRGPKSLLAGIAHGKAGRAAPAAAQFREAERVLRELLATDADHEDLRLALALTLAYQGRADDARSELAAVEPLLRGRKPYLYTGHAREMIAETYAVLGDVAGALPWLRLLFAEASAVPYTPASFRLDVRFDGIMQDPRVQALLAEWAPREATAAHPRSVAVLPFVNQSADKENEYFSDGIAEELLTTLQKIPGLKVAARASAWSFKGKSATTQEIGEKLGKAHIVEGTVQKSGNRVRVTVRLSRASTNEEIWSKSFGPIELTDVFAMQSELAQAIVAELRGRLTEEVAAGAAIEAEVRAARTGGTNNPEAHRLYLQGKFHFHKSTLAGWAEAERAFNAALQLDPNFVQAYCGLADLYGFMGGYTMLARTAWAKERQLAEKALALMPDSADAHVSLGMVLMGVFEWQRGEAKMKRALELNPNLALAHDQLSWAMTLHGRVDEAMEHSRQALELDPLSAVLSNNRAFNLQQMRRYDESIAQARKTIALQSNDAFAHEIIGWSLVFKRDFPAAIAEFRRARELDDVPRFAGSLAYALAVSGDRAGAEQLLKELDEIAQRRWVASGVRVIVYLGLGDTARALDWLEKSFDEQDQICWNLKVDRVFDPIRNEPRFRSLLQKAGFD